jgi:hypothetical protein
MLPVALPGGTASGTGTQAGPGTVTGTVTLAVRPGPVPAGPGHSAWAEHGEVGGAGLSQAAASVPAGRGPGLRPAQAPSLRLSG